MVPTHCGHRAVGRCNPSVAERPFPAWQPIGGAMPHWISRTCETRYAVTGANRGNRYACERQVGWPGADRWGGADVGDAGIGGPAGAAVGDSAHPTGDDERRAALLSPARH